MNLRKASLPLAAIFVFALLITACGGGEQRTPTSDLKEINGDRYQGGVFRYNETEYLRSLFPLNTSEVVGHRIVAQIYEGLVGFSQEDLTVKPSLAESWTISEDALTYTFKLRKGVRFHDDECFPDGKGREVTANDFMYCFTRLLTADEANKGFVFVKDRIKGGDAYYSATVKKETQAAPPAGIRVIDDYTFEVELEQPFSAILQIFSMPFCHVFPKEAFDMYGKDMRIKCVGTGPFKIRTVKEDDNVILARNTDYWGKDSYGNQLPYLDAVSVRFISEEKSEMLAFRNGEFEMKYRMPPEIYEEVLTLDKQLKEDYNQYQLQYMPCMTVEYYGFLHNDPDGIFDNKLLRQAMCYAIDRKKITDYVVKGTAAPALYGIVPPSFSGYDNKAIKGYDYNPDKARQLLKEAGYANGEGLPELTLQINSGGGRNEMVAEAITNMLEENLNIKASITRLEFAQHYENLESGKARFWRAGWVADYPDPENFLNLLYGGHVPEKITDNSYVNSVRYKSPIFDELLDKALRTVDPAERNLLYQQADQVAMDDAAILPIYYNIYHRLLQPYVRNFPQNAMEYRSFKDVYLVPLDAAAEPELASK